MKQSLIIFTVMFTSLISQAAINRAALISDMNTIVDIARPVSGDQLFSIAVRCVGERNMPPYHETISIFSITSNRMQKGLYKNVSDAALAEEIGWCVGLLNSMSNTNRCKGLTFTDPATEARWRKALENLSHNINN